MSRSKYWRILVCILLILFPASINLLTHSGSVILSIFALMGLWVVLSPQKQTSLMPQEKWVVWAFIIYFSAYLLSFIINGMLGCLENPRFRYIDHEFRLVLIILVLVLFRHFKVSSNVLWASILAGALATGAYALCSALWLNPGYRVSGSYHPIAFGGISLVLAFMSIPGTVWISKIKSSYLAIPLIAFILGFMACILSGTRGAWIAIPGLACIIFFYCSHFFNLGIRMLFVALCCLTAVAVYKIPATQVKNRIDAIFLETSAYAHGDHKYTPITTRIAGWRAALEIFSQNPIIGAGPENYEPLLHQMVAQGKPYKIATVHSQPHSTYLMTMVDCGTIGLLALLAVFAAPLWAAVRLIRKGGKSRDFGFALMIIVVSYMHFGLTETIFGQNSYIGFYVVMVAAILGVASNEKEPAQISDSGTCG